MPKTPAHPTCPVPSDILPRSEWSAVCAAITRHPEKALRRRPPAAHGAGEPLAIPFAVDPVPWFEGGLCARQTGQPGRYLQHAAGGYFVQDAGSLLALRLLDPQPREIIADVCASPGGKATGILEIVGPGGGFLLANEPIRGRLAPLAWTLARVGYSRYSIHQRDPGELADQFAGRFDAVLVDAPCTGQTLIGRGKQTAVAFSPRQIAHAASRQQRILHHAARLVRPGGRLVYSTCTFAPEENEQVAAWLVEQDPLWSVVDVEALAPWHSPRAPGGYRLWPHRDRSAGAYAILLRKEGERAPIEPDGRGDRREPLGPPAGCSRDFPFAESEVGRLIATVACRAGRQCFGWPSDAPAGLCHGAASGPEIAFQPSKVWQPAHALALRREERWQPARHIDLSDAEAQQYLRGMTLEATEPGWTVVRWRGHPLGWVHANAMRANNGLPPAARLSFTAPVEE